MINFFNKIYLKNKLKLKIIMIEKDDPKRKDICEKVIKTVMDQDIKFIYLQFTDIHGIIKSFEIYSKRIDDFLMDGEHFFGSSITGYDSIISFEH